MLGSDNGVSPDLLMEHIDKCGDKIDTKYISAEAIKGFKFKPELSQAVNIERMLAFLMLTTTFNRSLVTESQVESVE